MTGITVVAEGVHEAAARLEAATAASTGVAQSAWLLLALPLLGAVVLLVGGRRTDKWGHLLGSATVIATFVFGLVLFISATSLDAANRVQELNLFSWIPVNALKVDFGLRLDPLSLTFVLLITGVGSLIHVYSIGYMSHDRDRRKFFAYLNLFVAAMLLLVLGNGFVTLYFGWEGVGLASYLLIGWYQYRPAAATAAKKAFLMNRVGDVGLAVAIFLMFSNLGTTQFTEVFARIGTLPAGTVLAISLLLLLGACGKSGQFPLQAWLPDAMEGPTPVSALIHAATMVTAGVYLIARSHPIYDLTADGRLVVTIIGTITLLIGCVIGCAYDDIKKVLAYSTVSQIGYMVLAVGLGPIGYALGIAHLLAHGFFKAGLFLGAGSVMHGMNDEVDMRKYGGLARKMPITFVTFGLGYLALIGFPFLSGYFTKDAIIEAAFSQEGWRGWVFGGAAMLGVALTAFYMTRLVLMTFFGEKRWEKLNAELKLDPASGSSELKLDPASGSSELKLDPASGSSAQGKPFHPHESPAVMTVPMIVLAIGSVGAGWFLTSGNRLMNWLEPSLGQAKEAATQGPIPQAGLTALSLGLMVVGAGLAWLFVGRKEVPVTRPEKVSWVVRAARNDLYGNTLNEALFAKPGALLTKALVVTDDKAVDGAVTGLAGTLGFLSSRLRRTQTGFVRSYALTMLGGSVLVVAALLMVRFA